MYFSPFSTPFHSPLCRSKEWVDFWCVEKGRRQLQWERDRCKVPRDWYDRCCLMIKNQHLFVTSALYIHVEILQVPFGVRGQIMSLLESIESGRVESFFASVRYPTVVSTPCLELFLSAWACCLAKLADASHWKSRHRSRRHNTKEPQIQPKQIIITIVGERVLIVGRGLDGQMGGDLLLCYNIHTCN